MGAGNRPEQSPDLDRKELTHLSEPGGLACEQTVGRQTAGPRARGTPVLYQLRPGPPPRALSQAPASPRWSPTTSAPHLAAQYPPCPEPRNIPHLSPTRIPSLASHPNVKNQQWSRDRKTDPATDPDISGFSARGGRKFQIGVGRAAVCAQKRKPLR